ncbi:MAG: hypothetical protein JNK78_19730 [Planctomycetes bacterium]|nr:hypothetical protein [Planctomycetota bacterium]
MSLSRPSLFCALAGALFASCTVSERSFSLPAETVAAQIGPSSATAKQPRIFLAAWVEESQLAELAPYCGKQITIAERADDARCIREAVPRLVESRPDAILVVPGRTEVVGATTTFYSNPFVPLMMVSTTPEFSTNVVAYAMRAMRARLPFRYNTVSGTVLEIFDREATPGLLEGDVLTGIAGADALPPKAWPEWPLYARLLERVPGDVVELAWVRAGTGKMNGTARLLEPVGPHRAAREAIAVSTLGRIEEVDVGGRLIWRLNATLERRSRDRR